MNTPINPSLDATHILEDVVVLNLQVSIWSARKKLQAEDLLENASTVLELPPDDVASLGHKKVCDPAHLRIFNTLKTRACTLLSKHGVSFLGGWAIPLAKKDFILENMNEIQQEFLREKEIFLNQYDQLTYDWIAGHPEWSTIIERGITSPDYVRSRISFRWQTFQIAPPQGEDHQELVAEVHNLGNQLFEEIAARARDIWNKSFKGKSEVTHKSLRPFEEIASKLHGLGFVEPRVAPVVDIIEQALAAVPHTKSINGAALTMLNGLLSMLQDPQCLFEHGQEILQGRMNSVNIINNLTPPSLSSEQAQEVKETQEVQEVQEVQPAQETEPVEEAQELAPAQMVQQGRLTEEVSAPYHLPPIPAASNAPMIAGLF